MKKIIVFGGLNMDMSIESSRIPNAGESVVGRGLEVEIGRASCRERV